MTAASVAASLGAEVTLVESEILGGMAHLRDCVPSKAMIATANELRRLVHAKEMGISASSHLDLESLRSRITEIEAQLVSANHSLLESQGVRIVVGRGQLVDAHTIAVHRVEDGEEVERISVDAILLSTGSRARLPTFATIDGDRVMHTQQAYPPASIPEHLIVVGSGVTGVEFTHMFSGLGSAVSLIVSRQQVLPGKDPEVAAVLEEAFERRGVVLLRGARANGVQVHADGVTVTGEDGRSLQGSHVVFAIGSIPNTDGLGLQAAGIEQDAQGYLPVNRHCQTSVSHIYAAGDISGKLPLSSVATMQGRKIAEHIMGLHSMPHQHLEYEKAASAIFTDPEVADVGLAEAEAFAQGRKVRVTKVPFSTNPKSLIDGDARGFVKVISDPATGVVLGGSIVGRHAAELISVIALAVTAGLRTSMLMDTLLVHPARAEAIIEASS